MNEKEVEREYITIDGEHYLAESVNTAPDRICVSMSGMDIADAVELFKGVQDLSVSHADFKPYGVYSGLRFLSAEVDAEGRIIVTYHIANDVERRIAALEAGQEIQDGAIMDLASIVSEGGV